MTQLNMWGLPNNGSDHIVQKTKKQWLDAGAKQAVSEIADYGTFKDSLRAPVHRWFKYPAGYSYRLVEAKIRRYGLQQGCWILDPFVGSGTTAVEARRHGVNSIGIEAHPFVHWVAQTKIHWRLDLPEVAAAYHRVVEAARRAVAQTDTAALPELVHKCYSPANLTALMAIRDAVRQDSCADEIKNFLNLALTDTLRNASKAATGWPYIAPKKMHEKAVEKEAFAEFGVQVRRMVDDLEFMARYYGNNDAVCKLILGDARDEHAEIGAESIDLALTSPPYLNNYDYADRTRLETYFFGWYTTWGEITEQVRDQLMTSATTQIRRGDFGENGGLSEDIRGVDAAMFAELLSKVTKLAELRLTKGGRKSYDCLVAGYFNDMLQTLQQVYRTLQRGADFVLVLGDSAPYGVYIPTHEYLARLGLAVGFSSWQVEELRKRGDKWKANPQRHKVKLKEVILTLTK